VLLVGAAGLLVHLEQRREDVVEVEHMVNVSVTVAISVTSSAVVVVVVSVLVSVTVHVVVSVVARVTVWVIAWVMVWPTVCQDVTVTVTGGCWAGHDEVGGFDVPQPDVLSVMGVHLSCPKLGDT
jgi:hypothetical protein